MAFVLAMGAGLLGKSLVRLLNVDARYDPHNVVNAGVYVYGDRYHDKPDAETELLRTGNAASPRHTRHRGCVHGQQSPAHDLRSLRLSYPGPSTGQRFRGPSTGSYSVSVDYFNVIRIRLKRGRQLTDSDRKGTPLVAIVSESCARKVFPNADPIGKHIQLGAATMTKNG